MQTEFNCNKTQTTEFSVTIKNFSACWRRLSQKVDSKSWKQKVVLTSNLTLLTFLLRSVFDAHESNELYFSFRLLENLNS